MTDAWNGVPPENAALDAKALRDLREWITNAWQDTLNKALVLRLLERIDADAAALAAAHAEGRLAGMEEAAGIVESCARNSLVNPGYSGTPFRFGYQVAKDDAADAIRAAAKESK